MSQPSHFIDLPLAVGVAIGIFVTREVLDAVRRFNANRRKRIAIKTLLTAECERNKFVIGSLRQQVRSAEQARAGGFDMRIEEGHEGEKRLAFRGTRVPQFDAGPAIRSSIVRKPHKVVLDKYLFEAASIDSALFYAMERQISLIEDVNHIAISLIGYVSTDLENLAGFDEYALNILAKADEGNEALYYRCTLAKLSKGRVR